MPGSKYIDKAGRLAVMSEFALREFNIAEAEFDNCKDLIVLDDRTGAMFRVYVQSVVGRVTKAGAKARFRIPERVYNLPRMPQRRFVLAIRLDACWRFMIFTDDELRRFVRNKSIGKVDANKRGERFFDLHITIDAAGTPSIPEKPAFDLAFFFERWNLWPLPGAVTYDE